MLSDLVHEIDSKVIEFAMNSILDAFAILAWMTVSVIGSNIEVPEKIRIFAMQIISILVRSFLEFALK